MTDNAEEVYHASSAKRQVTIVHWIAVHEEVLGSKLRGFRKKVKCSEAEALGILTYMWLWARKNTDITGLLGNTDKADIASMIKPVLSDKLNADAVTNALVDCGWLDEVGSELYVHDWQEWQSYWYTYLDKREKDKERKRRERERARQNDEQKPDAPKNEADTIGDQKPNEEGKKEKKPKKPPKTMYADDVAMYPEEREKLVEQYGDEFTMKLIDELNNYKLSTGKRYKDDYRAILSWVVERCEKKYPNIRAKSARAKQTTSSDGNPFADYK